MDIEKFQGLWQESINSVSFEMRKYKDQKRIDKYSIERYYKINIVNNLWFSNSLANDYNDWILMNIPHDKILVVKNIMQNISVERNKSHIPYLCGAFAILALIMCVMFESLVFRICTTTLALGSIALGAYFHKKCSLMTNRNAVIGELQRIGNNLVETLQKIK